MLKKFSVKQKRLLAIALASAMVVSALAIGLGSTLAAKPPVVGDFTAQPNNYRDVEVGKTFAYEVIGAAFAASSQTSIATIPAGNIYGMDIIVTGVSAGLAVISVGSVAGLVRATNFQVWNNNNIVKYTIANGAEVFFSEPGTTVASPVTVETGANTTGANSAAFNAIVWNIPATQQNVATVNSATGAITAVGIGSAVLTGTFTDKWGVEQTMYILVMVGVRNGNLGELLKWVNKGKAILEAPDSDEVYTPESLGDLDGAVQDGLDVLDLDNPTDKQIEDAIDAIIDAINNLSKRPGGLIGPDSKGRYYRRMGEPPNVFEVVDNDGNSKVPPEYVYNEDGDPKGSEGKNKPAKRGEGNNRWTFYVEDPDGSNIWKPVDENGELDEDGAVWGGPDGKPGTDDDLPVKKFAGGYWANMGQNVWRKVNPSGGNNKEVGPLTGGGPDRNPETDPVTKIYTTKDGRYYVGPIGKDDRGNDYYYGDPLTGGDGFLDSTETALHGDDEKVYMTNSGRPYKPPTPPTEGGGSPRYGRVLTAEMAGDTSAWIEIATNGGYSLLVRAYCLKPGSMFDPNTSLYTNSLLRTRMNAFYPTLKADGALREFGVTSDVLNKLGNNGTTANSNNPNGFSTPSGLLATPASSDVTFPLSYQEVRNFCLGIDGLNDTARRNYALLKAIGDAHLSEWWLRTQRSSGSAQQVTSTYGPNGLYRTGNDGWVHADNPDWNDSGIWCAPEYGNGLGVRPAMWVMSAIFDE